jgi:hypothetical protein
MANIGKAARRDDVTDLTGASAGQAKDSTPMESTPGVSRKRHSTGPSLEMPPCRGSDCRPESTGSKIMFSSSLLRTNPFPERFWFPKSLEYWLRLSLVYCNTKDNPLQTNGFPIKVYLQKRKRNPLLHAKLGKPGACLLARGVAQNSRVGLGSS